MADKMHSCFAFVRIGEEYEFTGNVMHSPCAGVFTYRV